MDEDQELPCFPGVLCIISLRNFIDYLYFYKVYISFIGSVQESLVGVNSGGSDVLQLFTSTNLAYSVCFWTSFYCIYRVWLLLTYLSMKLILKRIDKILLTDGKERLLFTLKFLLLFALRL